MDSLKKLSETVDSNLNLIRQSVKEVLSGLLSKENQLNAVQESVLQRSKEVDMIRKSVEERLKEVVKKEEELKELQLIQEIGLKDLELKKREIEVREENLNEQEKLIQEFFERMELETRKFEDIQKSIDRRFAEISQKERILDEKLERHNQESELKEKIFISREAEFFAKEKELEGREKVLASRNDQIVFKEKQLELRNMILNLKTPEKDGCIVLADVGKGDFGLSNASPLLGESEDLTRKIEKTILGTELVVPPEGSLPKRNTGKNQVGREVAKEKKLEAKEEEELGPKEKEFEARKENEKSLTSVVAEDEEGGLREKVLPSRSDLIIPKEEQLDGIMGSADCGKGNSGKPNASPAQNGESRNLTQKSRKRGRPPTNQVELKILYMKTEEIDGNTDFADDVKREPGLPEVDAAQLGENIDSRIKGNKRGRTRKNQVTMSGNGDTTVVGNKSSESSPAKVYYPSTQIQKHPVSEFFDFEKDKQECLPGQTWASYDGADGMPRRYVRIWQKTTHGLRGGILVSEPTSKERDLPAGCGKFVCEGSRIILNPCKFSHQMVSESCSSGGYWIYPRKGEIWALFKDGEIASCSISGSRKQYKYEIVEVLSDFVKSQGIRVRYLEKIKGYVSLFQQKTESSPFLIWPNRLFHFSHRICAHEMNGTEREGVPKGSFELDPAALPSNFC